MLLNAFVDDNVVFRQEIALAYLVFNTVQLIECITFRGLRNSLGCFSHVKNIDLHFTFTTLNFIFPELSPRNSPVN